MGASIDRRPGWAFVWLTGVYSLVVAGLSHVITPKELVNAHIEERQKFIEMLSAKLEAKKAQVTFLRLTNQLDGWLKTLADDATEK